MLLPLFVGFCVGLCFGKHYFVSFLGLQSSWRGRESWLLYCYCLSDVLFLFTFCESSPWHRGLVCSVWLCFFLIILTNFSALSRLLETLSPSFFKGPQQCIPSCGILLNSKSAFGYCCCLLIRHLCNGHVFDGTSFKLQSR